MNANSRRSEKALLKLQVIAGRRMLPEQEGSGRGFVARRFYGDGARSEAFAQRLSIRLIDELASHWWRWIYWFQCHSLHH